MTNYFSLQRYQIKFIINFKKFWTPCFMGLWLLCNPRTSWTCRYDGTSLETRHLHGHGPFHILIHTHGNAHSCQGPWQCPCPCLCQTKAMAKSRMGTSLSYPCSFTYFSWFLCLFAWIWLVKVPQPEKTTMYNFLSQLAHNKRIKSKKWSFLIFRLFCWKNCDSNSLLLCSPQYYTALFHFICINWF